MDKNIIEMISNAEKIEDSENNIFDELYFGITRIFPRRHYRFLIPFTNLSDFTVEFVGDR